RSALRRLRTTCPSSGLCFGSSPPGRGGADRPSQAQSAVQSLGNGNLCFAQVLLLAADPRSGHSITHGLSHCRSCCCALLRGTLVPHRYVSRASELRSLVDPRARVCLQLGELCARTIRIKQNIWPAGNSGFNLVTHGAVGLRKG